MPTQVAFLVFAGCHADGPGTQGITGNQSATASPDVMQSKCSGSAEQFAALARQSDASQRTAEACSGGSEPDLISCRRPGGTEGARPALGQLRPLAVQVHDTDGSSVISQQVVINECQAISLGREAQMADPAGGFIQYFANRILDSALAVHHVDYGEGVSIGRPIRSFNIVQQVARSVRADGNLSQRSAMGEMIGTDVKAAQHCHLSRCRNGQYFGLRQAEIAGFGRIRRADKDCF